MEGAWIRVINLNAKLRDVEKEEVDALSVVAEATRTDRELDAWRAGVKPEFTCSITPILDVQEVLPADDLPSEDPLSHVRHVYTSEWSAEVWNKWRIMKILSQSLILEYSPAEAMSTEALERCHHVIRELSVDICLSVPSSRKSRPTRSQRGYDGVTY